MMMINVCRNVYRRGTQVFKHIPIYTRRQVHTAEEGAKPVIITDRCAEMIKQIRNTKKNDNIKLRVTVDSGGCSGYKYGFELSEELTDSDVVFERNGAQVVIDDISLKYLQGAHIDHQTEMIKTSFRVLDNPQSSKSCNCGISFNTKDTPS